jgi:hypothetical protein
MVGYEGNCVRSAHHGEAVNDPEYGHETSRRTRVKAAMIEWPGSVKA